MWRAIVQIFCLAPSIKPVIEDVVSSTNTTSSLGETSAGGAGGAGEAGAAAAGLKQPTTARPAKKMKIEFFMTRSSYGFEGIILTVRLLAADSPTRIWIP